MKEANENLTELNREQLGLFPLGSVKDPMEDLKPTERRQYVAKVTGAYDLVKGEIDNLIALQVDHIARYAESWEKILIARGSINMGMLLLERFEQLKNEHLENTKPKEEFDEKEIFN